MPHANVRRVLMLAAEHGGLPNGKVGGIGDVVQELPPALVAHGVGVDVLLPSYGVYHTERDATLIAEFEVEFAGSTQQLALYRLADIDGAGCLILQHPAFGMPPGQIYHHDPADQPFATDANIYALFCAAAIALLEQRIIPQPDVVHLHDWHAATFALLARCTPSLQALRIVYSIHNLALQGIRPLQNHPSSLSEWFPGISFPLSTVQDPRYDDCYNPVRGAVAIADKVHVVSPTYAAEVLVANDPETGRHGGEGLEHDLRARAADGDLIGILNGCHYQDTHEPTIADVEAFARERSSLLQVLRTTLDGWVAQHEQLRGSDYLARETLQALRKTLPGRMLVTSVGRITEQKVGLLLGSHPNREGTLLDRLLRTLGDNGALLLLGSGDDDLESNLVEHAARHDNFLFAKGYSDALANALYAAGDLFLMPSLFEPCGISQLLAMRAGQPCLVHATGGLQDTIDDGIDGFQFSGDDQSLMADACEAALERAMKTRANPRAWRDMRSNAAAKRFTWNDAALGYLRDLYNAQR